MSKSTKALQELIKQMDTLLPTLSGKDAATLLIEKASIIRQQIAMDQAAADTEAKIESLTEQLTAATSEVTRLTDLNVRLKQSLVTAENRAAVMRASANTREQAPRCEVRDTRVPTPTTEAELRRCGVPLPAVTPVPLTPPPAPRQPYVPDSRDTETKLREARALTKGMTYNYSIGAEPA